MEANGWGRRRLSAGEPEDGEERTARLSTWSRFYCAMNRGSQVYCSANRIISCLPYGFQDT